MKNFKKAFLMVLCVVAIAGASIFGTLAYLTSTTGPVTNTFTVGNVAITLDEAPVDADGKETTGERVYANAYDIFPGQTYDKDPTVHVDANSEDCWLFVKVDNGIVDIEGDTKIVDQMATKGWTLVDGKTNIYAYKDIVTADQDVVVFETFTIAGTVDNDTLATYSTAKIIIEAYAVQAEGFATSAAAWTAAPLAAWN